VTAESVNAHPIVTLAALAENESAVPVMQPPQTNVYDIWVEFMNVPFAIGDSDKLAFV